MKRQMLFILCMLGSLLAAAQSNYEFKVIASYGNNQKELTGERLWAGSELHAQDRIVVAIGGYLALMHKNGHTLELKKPGTYVVANLSQQVPAGAQTTTQKYFRQVVSEVKKVEQENLHTAHRKYMAITGAVQRRWNAVKLKVLLPVTEPVIVAEPNEVLIAWMRPDKVVRYTYQIKVMNMNPEKEEVVATYSTQDTTLTLDLNKLTPYKDEEGFLVKITTEENPQIIADEFYVGKEENQERLKVIQTALAGMNDDGSALSAFLRASICKEHGFIADAIKYYMKAIERAPEVDLFRLALIDYLAENKIAFQKAE
jgi:hypothetical protein